MDEHSTEFKFFTPNQFSNEINKNIEPFVHNETTTSTTFSLTFLLNKDEKSSDTEQQNYVCDFSLLEKYLSTGEESDNVELYNQMIAKSQQTARTDVDLNVKALKKRFSCEFCQRPFKKKCNLIAHERTHTGERPFQCTMCDKTFTESSSVFKHQRVHTGERPYQCDICDHRFKQICNLKRHRNEHFYRVYECDMCEKCFVRETHLIHHRVLTHSLYGNNDLIKVEKSKD